MDSYKYEMVSYPDYLFRNEDFTGPHTMPLILMTEIAIAGPIKYEGVVKLRDQFKAKYSLKRYSIHQLSDDLLYLMNIKYLKIKDGFLIVNGQPDQIEGKTTFKISKYEN